MKPDTPVSITLPAEEWNVILGALQDVPYRYSAGIITSINEQAVKAMEPGQPA